jgi:hypothetical protein
MKRTSAMLAFTGWSLPYKKLSMFALLACLGLLFVVLTTGCGRSTIVAAKNVDPPTPAADLSATSIPEISPETLATARNLIANLGCVGCHTIDSFPEAQGMIGPNLSHIYTQSPDIIASPAYKAAGHATNARDYLRESILSPSTYVYPDCPTGPCPDFVMPRDFKKRITPGDLEIILDLLSTFK